MQPIIYDSRKYEIVSPRLRAVIILSCYFIGARSGKGRLLACGILLLLSLFLAPCSARATPTCPDQSFPARYSDPERFENAIQLAAKLPIRPRLVSGLTVPHHLLAADLIARGFRFVEPTNVYKVIILFPDHFKKTHLPFATTTCSFETVFGLVQTQRSDAERLLSETELVQDSGLFAHDHGIGALLPFVKHYFPRATVVPIAVSISSHRSDWDRLEAILATLIDPRTLIIQSTDFSHYLPLAAAIPRDQETLNVLAAGDLAAAAELRQPDNTDSRGALYIQLKLQSEVWHAKPTVLANANSQTYSDVRQQRTTSYMIELFGPDGANQIGHDDDGSKVYCFAGDTFLGRYVAEALANRTAARRIRAEMKSFLGRCRLVVNLEGVMLPRVPKRLGPTTLAMSDRITLRWLHALNVTAVGVANNHVMDFGAPAYARMVRRLRRSGFRVLQAGRMTDVGGLRVVAFTDLDNASRRASGIVSSDDFRRLTLPPHDRRPAVAFMHWGQEGIAAPGDREQTLAAEFAEVGLPLIVGAHPHRACTALSLVAGPKTLSAYSLGNFLFDQNSSRSSGAILEVRLFRQGTVFARLIPIPNFFERRHSRSALE